MSEKRATSRTGIYRIIVILFAFLIRLININAPLIGQQHDFRQSQTAIVIQCFFKDGMDILGYQIPVFGAPWKVPFELPLYQSLVYICMRAFGACDITLWSRIISVLIFLASAVVLWLIVYNILDNRIADITVFIYLFAPFCVYWSRAILIDYFSVLLALLYTYGIVRFMKTTNYLAFVVSCIFGVLAYLQKSTTMFSFVFFIFCYLLNYYWSDYKTSGCNSIISWAINYLKESCNKTISLVIGCVLPVIPAYYWNKYADLVKESGNVFTQYVTSNRLTEWTYGTIEQRLSIRCWMQVMDHISELFGGTIVMFLVLLVYFVFTRRQRLFMMVASFGAVFIAPLILFNLYYVHSYYSIAITPFSALCMGIMISGIYNNMIMDKMPIKLEITVLLFATFILFNGLPYIITGLYSPTYFDYSLKLLSDISDENDEVIITGCDWNPVVLYLLNMKGTMICHWEGCDNQTILNSIIIKDDYDYLYGIDINDNEFYINAFPNNIQYICNDGVFLASLSTADEAEHLLSDNEWIETFVENHEIVVCCNNETVLRLVRNDISGSCIQPVDVYLDGELFCSTCVIFADGADSAYIDTRGISGNIQLLFSEDSVSEAYYCELPLVYEE